MRKAQGHGRQVRLQYILSQGLENNHYKLPPLRITTSIFKITKMSLEKGAVSCPRSKLLRRGPETGNPLYSTSKHSISTALLWLISLMSAFWAVMIPQSTLKTQVINTVSVSRLLVCQARKPRGRNLTTHCESCSDLTQETSGWKPLLFLQPWRREKDAPENSKACSKKQNQRCTWILTSSEQHRKS